MELEHTHLSKDRLDDGMEVGIALGGGDAQPLAGAARCRWLLWRAAARRLGAEAGRRAGDDSLPGLEEERRLVSLPRGAPPVPSLVVAVVVVMVCSWRRLAPGGGVVLLAAVTVVVVLVLVGMFGPGGLAALLVVPTRPLCRILLRVIALVLPVGVTFLQPVVTTSRVSVPWLAEGSLRACLALFRPARIIAASSRGGMMLMLLRAVAPVIARTSLSAEPRRSEQGGGGVALGQSGAHDARPLQVAK